MQEPAITRTEAEEIVHGKTAPKVTKESIEAKIENTTFIRHEHLTICVIEMRNGFFAVGKAAPASPENYDQAVGERYAYEDAFRSLWQFEGYSLRDRLAATAEAALAA